ncbi:MAG TPA: TolC family protein [Burkholderiales bacterium]|nr:TolC family protein [Burkholderiales bacterium]
MMDKTDTRPILAGAAVLGFLLFADAALPAGTQPPPIPAARTVADQSLLASEEPIGEITLNRAQALALAHNAELVSFARGFGASEAAVVQAGALPNPVLGAAGENLGNNRVKEDGDRATVIQLEQLIELGGKRAARLKLAETGRDLTAWDYQSKRADVILQVSIAFIDVLAGQQRLLMAEEVLSLARAFADSVSKRVAAGKVSPVEETKARLSLYSADVELEQAKRELAAVRQRLSSLWNNPVPRFETAVGDLEQIISLPSREQLFGRARANPDLARWGAEIAQRDAAVEVAKARGVPDLTLTGGVSRFSQFNDTAYTIGISIPIPLFDRNRGGILEAVRLLDKTVDQKRAAENRVHTEINNAEQRLAAIRIGIETLRTSILPGAQSALDATRKGYELGKFGFIDVIDAQRTLSLVRSQYLGALATYHRGVREIERLIGDELDREMSAITKKQAGDQK